MIKNMVLALTLGVVIGVGGMFVALTAVGAPEQIRSHEQTALENLKHKKGDEFDKAFIEEMITHHQGAIDMASLIDANAKHEELKKLGADIKQAQSKEVDMMQVWQGDWGYKVVPKSHTDMVH